MIESVELFRQRSQWMGLSVSIPGSFGESIDADDQHQADTVAFLMTEAVAALETTLIPSLNQWLSEHPENEDAAPYTDGSMLHIGVDPQSITYQLLWGLCGVLTPAFVLINVSVTYQSLEARARHFLAAGGDVGLARASYEQHMLDQSRRRLIPSHRVHEPQ